MASSLPKKVMEEQTERIETRKRVAIRVMSRKRYAWAIYCDTNLGTERASVYSTLYALRGYFYTP